MRTTEACWPMHLNIGEMVIGQRGVVLTPMVLVMHR